jgi:septum formation protein
VRPADVEELGHGDADAVARENALRKARAAPPGPGERVIGVDTVVALDGAILGKQPDEAGARATLRTLSGRTHTVVSAVALLDAGGAERLASQRTAVTFRALDEPLVDWYLACGEWRGRAGCYAVQGRGGALVERLEGELLNVVGLPLGALLQLWPDLLPPGG